MERYKGYKDIIKQAELMAMTPDAVAVFLAQRARQSKDEWRNDEVHDDTEAALLARGDAAINLALAKHGRFIATVKALFTSGEPSGATRLAVLSNTVVGDEIFSKFPTELFDDEDQAAAWLISAPSEELLALFENHNLDDSFLRDLLEGKKPWDQIPDGHLATIVSMLHRNERMWRPYDDDFMDGYAEYRYGAVFSAAWTLAERVEPTVRWGAALSYLYERMETDAFPIMMPLEVAARWQIDPSDADAIAEESKDVVGGWLSNHQGVRKGLARLALCKDSKLLPSLLASDDPALRAAVYSDGEISPEQLSAAYERDGELVFNQAMHNHKIWRHQAGREALRSIAWAVVNADKHSDLLAANIFNKIQTDLSKKHPGWFKDEDDADYEDPILASLLEMATHHGVPMEGGILTPFKTSRA